ncbi:MAG TPA: TAXI family TRAP transporter solute-binding subunit [Rhodocyclaceae bacterium]|nr:TAXI family TRAP transporter solute-binding subunit [Rhodocyclaceae bacterium]
MKLGLRMLVPAAAAAIFSTAVGADTYAHISAPFGTGSYVLGGALEQIVNRNHPQIRISHSESPGFVFNHNQLERDPSLRKTMIVGSGRGVNAAAAAGMTPFEKPTLTVKALANYNLGTYFLATLDPNIQGITDLAGKSVALGRRTQINWAVQPEALLRVGAGLDAKVQYLGTKEAVDALLDGQVDAAIVGGYLDPITNKMQLAPQTQEFVASGRDIRFLPWTVEAIDKVVASGMPMIPVTLPAEALPGRTEPLQSFADTVSWTVHEDFPVEAAYEITKLIIEHVDSFRDYHSLGTLMSRKALPFGWEPEELHPGALRAYREAGILD